MPNICTGITAQSKQHPPETMHIHLNYLRRVVLTLYTKGNFGKLVIKLHWGILNPLVEGCFPLGCHFTNNAQPRHRQRVSMK
jgi:hypothetical protein